MLWEHHDPVGADDRGLTSCTLPGALRNPERSSFLAVGGRARAVPRRLGPRRRPRPERRGRAVRRASRSTRRSTPSKVASDGNPPIGGDGGFAGSVRSLFNEGDRSSTATTSPIRSCCATATRTRRTRPTPASDHVPVLTSGGLFGTASRHDVLPDLPTWSSPGYVWAPSLLQRGDDVRALLHDPQRELGRGVHLVRARRRARRPVRRLDVRLRSSARPTVARSTPSPSSTPTAPRTCSGRTTTARPGSWPSSSRPDGLSPRRADPAARGGGPTLGGRHRRGADDARGRRAVLPLLLRQRLGHRELRDRLRGVHVADRPVRQAERRPVAHGHARPRRARAARRSSPTRRATPGSRSTPGSAARSATPRARGTSSSSASPSPPGSTRPHQPQRVTHSRSGVERPAQCGSSDAETISGGGRSVRRRWRSPRPGCWS